MDRDPIVGQAKMATSSSMAADRSISTGAEAHNAPKVQSNREESLEILVRKKT